MKCLLQPVVQGGSRSWRLSLYRPVTPEVAGSSPVAPVSDACGRLPRLIERRADGFTYARDEWPQAESSREGQILR
jgi:hypothetical protein